LAYKNFYYSEWFAAADKMLLEECKNIDVIITTALIPGRKAPVLIKKHHVEAMPSGGVTIDLAAASGGNVETTVAGMSKNCDLSYPTAYNVSSH
jgi:H+-translocating NAD(P) transhydrogenase